MYEKSQSYIWRSNFKVFLSIKAAFKGGIFFDSYTPYKQHTKRHYKPKLLWVQLYKRFWYIYVRKSSQYRSQTEFVFHHRTTLHFVREQQSKAIQPFSEASRHIVPQIWPIVPEPWSLLPSPTICGKKDKRLLERSWKKEEENIAASSNYGTNQQQQKQRCFNLTNVQRRISRIMILGLDF